MSLDPQAAAYLEAAAALGMPTNEAMGPVAARAAAIAAAPRLSGPIEPVLRVEDRQLPGPAGPIPVRVYAPHPGPLPLLAYFHGGGWVIGNLDTHDVACRALANAAGCMVVAVDYRLAPEHRSPTALEDCWAAVTWLAEHGQEIGADARRIAVGGDSAGGQLAALVAIRARDTGAPALAFQLLIYPVTDHDFDTPSYHQMETGFGLTRDGMRWFWDCYLGPADGEHASPLRAPDLSGVASALVITCEYDPLRDEGDAYARRLAAAGVSVEHIEEAGMIHGYFRLPAVIDRARKSYSDCAAALRAAFEA